jgi:hypothetical protein
MKRLKEIMSFAHALKNAFSYTLSTALKLAWKIIKSGSIAFVKETGEMRTANVKTFFNFDLKKGFVKFIEKLDDGAEQFRSMRFERIVLNIVD